MIMHRKGKFRKLVLAAGIILTCSFFTIIGHALIPVKADETRFDSILIMHFGFPVIAVFYFVLLYTQCALALRYFSEKGLPTGNTSSRNYGTALALLYMIGMQEIMLSVSPFTEWDIHFVTYQAVVGLGDAIPVLLLCTLLGRLFVKTPSNHHSGSAQYFKYIAIYTLTLGTVRTLASATHIIDTCISVYAVEVIAWNYAFGFIAGICYCIIRSSYAKPWKVMLFGFSINWIIFNSFIGMIKKDTMTDALLRSIMDAAVIAAIALLLDSDTSTLPFRRTRRTQ